MGRNVRNMGKRKTSYCIYIHFPLQWRLQIKEISIYFYQFYNQFYILKKYSISHVIFEISANFKILPLKISNHLTLILSMFKAIIMVPDNSKWVNLHNLWNIIFVVKKEAVLKLNLKYIIYNYHKIKFCYYNRSNTHTKKNCNFFKRCY